MAVAAGGHGCCSMTLANEACISNMWPSRHCPCASLHAVHQPSAAKRSCPTHDAPALIAPAFGPHPVGEAMRCELFSMACGVMTLPVSVRYVRDAMAE
jgi:hypothetical protein